MGKIIKILFLVVVLSSLGVFYYQQNSICYSPLAYDLGSFDPRFGISKDKFLNITKEAETIWEKGTGKELFVYQPQAKFKINLVFDERQETTFEATKSEKQVENSRAQYDTLVSQYKTLSAAYERNLSEYNSAVARFEQRLTEYNRRVAEINSRGGATPKEYQELEKERIALESEKYSLDSQRSTLNKEASDLNAFGDQVNALAQKLNINVDIHNERFGEAREFDQGDYQGNKINIYQFEATSDLRLVLAHELGHALGLDHVENPKSIMYYLMDKQDLINTKLSAEDKEAFRKRCEFHVPKLKDFFNYPFSTLSTYSPVSVLTLITSS